MGLTRKPFHFLKSLRFPFFKLLKSVIAPKSSTDYPPKGQQVLRFPIFRILKSEVAPKVPWKPFQRILPLLKSSTGGPKVPRFHFSTCRSIHVCPVARIHSRYPEIAVAPSRRPNIIPSFVAGPGGRQARACPWIYTSNITDFE